MDTARVPFLPLQFVHPVKRDVHVFLFLGRRCCIVPRAAFAFFGMVVMMLMLLALVPLFLLLFAAAAVTVDVLQRDLKEGGGGEIKSMYCPK